MQRRSFVKNTMLGGMAFTIPAWLPVQSNRTKQTFLKIIPDPSSPAFSFFSIDSLGKGLLADNLVLTDFENKPQHFTSTQKGGRTQYRSPGAARGTQPQWELVVKNSSFSLTSHAEKAAVPFVINISQYANHATLLGIMTEKDHMVSLPAIFHLPDKGTLRITCETKGHAVKMEAQRFIDHPYVKLSFPPATDNAEKIEYDFEVTTIHPAVAGIDNDPDYDCFRRNFISIFQLNPRLKVLANNSASDACAFTLYEYAEMAKATPPLADGLTALDLIRETLNRYLNGQKAYGLLGYDYDKTWDIPETPTNCNYLDSFPSLIMSACIYAGETGDRDWYLKHFEKIKNWTEKMLATDQDGDGLLEFCLSGNSGSWKGDRTMRPANWWDTIGFGHKDAYSNALAYRAMILLSEVNRKFGKNEEATAVEKKAQLLRSAYAKTFLNPATGILAGWKSADGKLHDYYFIFVNAVAIHYGLIDDVLANDIMDRLFAKMKDVGYDRFNFGLPGNLIPVIRADYTDLLPEVGGGKREDNLDGFQIYENGGATACFTYFTISALQKLGRKKDADAILKPLLKSMSEGNFQGRCANGKTKDWKSWKGECWGYEGFLVDNYLFLKAVISGEEKLKT